LSAGAVGVRVDATLADSEPAAGLYRPATGRPDPDARTDLPLTAVPYFSWANREIGAMRVWVPSK